MDPLLYQYAIGGLIFGVGLIYAWRQGYVGLSGRKRRPLVIVVAGLLFFFGLQAYLQYAPMSVAEPVPYQGEGLEEGTIGTTLDYGIMVAYFAAMLGIGTWFGRHQASTKDFFFGGQRFAWWLIAFSLIATTVGSYSFVKYSKIAYSYGIASSQTYLNDWFWLPLLLFGWLPILYFSRVVSIPEYFERRFGPAARRICTVLLLVYLIGYVGINLFTMGTALHILLGWPVLASAAGIAAISAIYVTAGGQTSVIMTDLFQGVMLLATGLVLLYLGIEYLGGPGEFWNNLPRGHRTAFTNFNTDPNYNSVGIFWQDAMANSAMFYFLNQGLVMRLLAARSVQESRKAIVATMLVLMPVAAVVVASGGWVGKALVGAGVLPPDLPADEAFFVAAEFLSRPGVFGLLMAALTAALMSTVDTLITAVAAIAVNDVYRPLRPQATEKEMLRVARISSVSVTLLGVALVPVFMSFGSIYSAHGAFTAAITPPLVVTLLFGVFWRRFTPRAAWWTLVGGGVVIFLSILFPILAQPFAHGVPLKDVGEGFLAGKDQFKFMRACFGILCCAGIGVVATLLTKPKPAEQVRGLVWGTVADAIRHYKGKPGQEGESTWALARPRAMNEDPPAGHAHLPVVRISHSLSERLVARADDLVYVTDARWWLGGLRSSQAVVGEVSAELPEDSVELGPTLHGKVVGARRKARPLRIKRLY